MTVAVVGASGFIGRAVVAALRANGHDVHPVTGLRVSGRLDRQSKTVLVDPSSRDQVAAAVRGCRAVVNAAGDPDASSTDVVKLRHANAMLPGLLAEVVSEAPEARLVHVSSAVVQGRVATLTASDEVDPFSVYAQSKIEGEQLVRRALPGRHVIYRPPSVHAADRRVSRSIVRLAESPLRSVASPGTAPSPQALIQNVASAVAFLATCGPQPPDIVIHPWEGITTAGLMKVLGGRDPHVLPRGLARGAVEVLERVGRHSGLIAANARRVEMMWFGQGQADSWLTEAGWKPPVGIEGWEDLRMRIKNGAGHRENGAVR